MQNTLYQEKSGTFLAKTATLRIEASTDSKKSQKLGEVKLNLIEYLAEPASSRVFFLSSCADKKARIVLSIKSSALGEHLGDTLSDASGSENFSEEGSLHSEQDHSIEKTSKKPPVFRPLGETTPEEKQRIINLMAKLSLLEKENQQIKSEKEDIKVQLALNIENSTREREKFCEHSLNLDAEIEDLKHRNRRLEKKADKYREKYRRANKESKEVNEEVEVLKSNFPESEKVKLLDLMKTVKRENFELKQEMMSLKNVMEVHDGEREIEENAQAQMQSLNLRYLAEISALKVKVLEGQELYALGASEGSGNKKKVEAVLNEIKKELEKLQNDRDEALAKNTDFLVEIQRLKRKQIESNESLNAKLRALEFEMQEKIEENLELNERLNDEISKSKAFERRTITEKQEVTDQITKITKTYQEAVESNDLLSKTLREAERKNIRNRSESEPSSYERLQKTLQSYLSETQKLKQDLSASRAECQEYRLKIQDLQSELSKIHNLSQDDQSDLSIVSQKLESSSKLYLKERNELEDKVNLLKQEMELLQDQMIDQQKTYESQITELKVKAISLEDSVKIPKTSAEFVSSLGEETYKQSIEMNKIEIKELKGLVMKLQGELKDSERKYMDLKVSLANFDLEKESVSLKYKEINDQLLEYSNNYTTMEIEFFRANEKLAKVLNENNDLVNEVEFLKLQIFNLQKRRKRK